MASWSFPVPVRGRKSRSPNWLSSGSRGEVPRNRTSPRGFQKSKGFQGATSMKHIPIIITVFAVLPGFGQKIETQKADRTKITRLATTQNHLSRSEEHTSELQSLRHLVC